MQGGRSQVTTSASGSAHEEARAGTSRLAKLVPWAGLWRRRKHARGAQPSANVSVPWQITAECEAMASYAMASGLRVPASALHAVAEVAGTRIAGAGTPTLDLQQWRRLVQAHDQLVQVVSPATPRTLLLLSEDAADGKLQALGAVPLVRRMLWASILSLVVFLLTALSPKVGATSGNIFEDSGSDLLINELFFLAAAGIGAAFAALFTANHYIAQGTYDPKYEASYWVRFVLGLIAGIVLSSLVPVSSGASGGESLTRPFLALLGGFSAAVVFRILNRFVGTLESLVQGDGAADAATRTRLEAGERTQQRLQDQLRVSAGLVKLREQLSAGAPTQAMVASIGELLDDLLPADIVAEGAGVRRDPEPESDVAAAAATPEAASGPPRPAASPLPAPPPDPAAGAS